MTRFLFLAMSALLLALPLSACGGGGGGGGGDGGPPPILPPTNLTLTTSDLTVETDGRIPANVPTADGDPVDTWSVSPALPPGLYQDAASGAILGTPARPMSTQTFTVTGTNSAGSDSTTFDLTIYWSDFRDLAPHATPSDAEIRHFLNRTHFGFSQTHYDAIVAQGFEAYVNSMTTLGATPTLETAARNAYVIDPTDDPEGRFPSLTDLSRYWLYMMSANPNPFQEVYALKLHDHFATAVTDVGNSSRYYMLEHIRKLREDGSGNLRTFLLNLARDWAMLEWLDGVRSVKGSANENFGREWFELYCFGVDNGYTEEDIAEAARAFTGYQSQYNSTTGQRFIVFVPGRHDDTDKTVLGQTVVGQNATDDYERMVDITLGDMVPGANGVPVSRCAQWIIKSLVEYFLYPDAPATVIDELADDLRTGGWNMQPVMAKMLSSRAMFSVKAKDADFVKSPVELTMGFGRTTGLAGDPAVDETVYKNVVNITDAYHNLMGQRPSEPPVVDGWPVNTEWLSSQSMIDRSNALLWQLRYRAEDVATLMPAGTPDAAAVVDELAIDMRLTLTPAERQSYIDYLNSNRNSDGSIDTSEPFDSTNANHIDERLRGLLYILSLHPSYSIR